MTSMELACAAALCTVAPEEQPAESDDEKNELMLSAQRPFCDRSYEWDAPDLSWKAVGNMPFPQTGTVYDGMPLGSVIKSRHGRSFVHAALQMRELLVEQPDFIHAATFALEQHTQHAKIYHSKLRKQKRAQQVALERASKKAERELEKRERDHLKELMKESKRVKAAAIKQAKLEEKENKKRAREQIKIDKQQTREAMRIMKAAAGPRKRRRKNKSVVSSDEGDSSSSSTSSPSASSEDSDDLMPPPLPLKRTSHISQ